MIKKITIYLLTLSFIGLCFGYILDNSVTFGLCSSDSYTCRGLFNGIGEPLLYGMGALTVTLLALLFVPRAFSVWWKFAIWYVPFAVLVFATIPESHGWISIIPTPDSIYRWVSGIYIAISLVLIGFATRKKAK